jgi:hypothetical protein
MQPLSSPDKSTEGPSLPVLGRVKIPLGYNFHDTSSQLRIKQLRSAGAHGTVSASLSRVFCLGRSERDRRL